MPRQTPVTAKWPTAVITTTDTGIYTNFVGKTLNEDVAAGSGAVTAAVAPDTSGLEAGMFFMTRGINGPEIAQISSVDSVLSKITFNRAKDGTSGVAHKSGQKVRPVIPALAINQVVADLAAVQTFLGVTGGTSIWDRHLVLNPSTTGPILALDALTSNASLTMVDFRRDGVSVGSMVYDVANDQMEFQNIVLTAGVGSNILLEDGRELRFGTDNDARFLYDSALNIVTYGGVALEPATDNNVALGSAARRWSSISVGPGSYKVFAAASDANPSLLIGTSGYQAGAGGASAIDVAMARQAASVYQVTGSLAGSVRFGMGGAGQAFWSLRAAAADAQPYLRGDQTGLLFGAGGASATDVLLARQAASILEQTGSVAGSVRFGESSAGVAFVSLRAAAADANPYFRVDSTGLLFGAGAASAVDVQLSRGAADRLDLASGDTLRLISGLLESTTTFTITPASGSNLNLAVAGAGGVAVAGTVLFESDRDLAVNLLPNADNTLTSGSAARRWASVNGVQLNVYGAASDANPVILASSSGLAFGAGGASATDILLARSAAGFLSHTGSAAGAAKLGVSGGASGGGFFAFTLAADANAAAYMDATGFGLGAGGGTSPDVLLKRGAANRLDLATGDSFRVVNGSIQFGDGSFYYNLSGAPTADRTLTLPNVGGGLVVQQLGNMDITNTPGAGQVLAAISATEATWTAAGGGGLGLALASEAYVTIGNTGGLTAERALTMGTGLRAVDGGANSTITLNADQSLAPQTDIGFSLGTSALRYLNVIGNNHYVYGAASDANPVALLSSAGLAFGAGGGSATDLTVSRSAAGVLKIDVSAATAGGLIIDGQGTGTIDTRLTIGQSGNGGAGRGTAILIRGPGSSNEVDLVKLDAFNPTASATPTATYRIELAVAGTLTDRFDIDGGGQVSIPTTGSGAGLLLGADAQWYRGAADKMYLASGDTLHLVSGLAESDTSYTITPASGSNINLAVAGAGGVAVAGTVVFESDRDLAVNLIPNASNSLDLGSSTRLWRALYLGATAPTAANTGQVGYANGGLQYADGSVVQQLLKLADAQPAQPADPGSGVARTPSTTRDTFVLIDFDWNTVAAATGRTVSLSIDGKTTGTRSVFNADAVTARRHGIGYSFIVRRNQSYTYTASSSTNLTTTITEWTL